MKSLENTLNEALSYDRKYYNVATGAQITADDWVESEKQGTLSEILRVNDSENNYPYFALQYTLDNLNVVMGIFVNGDIKNIGVFKPSKTLSMDNPEQRSIYYMDFLKFKKLIKRCPKSNNITYLVTKLKDLSVEGFIKELLAELKYLNLNRVGDRELDEDDVKEYIKKNVKYTLIEEMQ